MMFVCPAILSWLSRKDSVLELTRSQRPTFSASLRVVRLPRITTFIRLKTSVCKTWMKSAAKTLICCLVYERYLSINSFKWCLFRQLWYCNSRLAKCKRFNARMENKRPSSTWLYLIKRTIRLNSQCKNHLFSSLVTIFNQR